MDELETFASDWFSHLIRHFMTALAGENGGGSGALARGRGGQAPELGQEARGGVGRPRGGP